jgi:hypothetical protein
MASPYFSFGLHLIRISNPKGIGIPYKEQRGWHTPRPGGPAIGPLEREAAWSAVARYRFSPFAQSAQAKWSVCVVRSVPPHPTLSLREREYCAPRREEIELRIRVARRSSLTHSLPPAN